MEHCSCSNNTKFSLLTRGGEDRIMVHGKRHQAGTPWPGKFYHTKGSFKTGLCAEMSQVYLLPGLGKDRAKYSKTSSVAWPC